ncbi:MAG: hypothetical protein K2H30_07055, partial [Clostridia bacterium]|nr:hypothetical protein [Clostridia bacterium]
IDELPDYDELMAQIAELNSSLLTDDEEDGNYLYKKDEYVEKAEQQKDKEEKKAEVTEDGYELPDFISKDDDVIKID